MMGNTPLAPQTLLGLFSGRPRGPKVRGRMPLQQHCWLTLIMMTTERVKHVGHLKGYLSKSVCSSSGSFVASFLLLSSGSFLIVFYENDVVK